MGDIMAAARDLAEKHGATNVVVASDAGGSARDVLKAFGPDYNIVAVATPPETERMPEVHKVIEELSGQGVRYLMHYPILSHPISPIDARLHPLETDPIRVIRHTLHIFGEGAKVCVEIALIACDNDMLPPGEDCVAVARTPAESNSPHTAMVIHPVKSTDFFGDALRVKETVLIPGPKDHWFGNGPLWQG